MKRIIQLTMWFFLSSIAYSQTVSSIIDPRDGQSYQIVKIGDQWWMAENLKATIYSDGTPIDYPGEDETAWKNNTTVAYS
jgi:hypothetical protein